MNTLTPKTEGKDRADFKVKIGGEKRRVSRSGKEMILGERHRTIR